MRSEKKTELETGIGIITKTRNGTGIRKETDIERETVIERGIDRETETRTEKPAHQNIRRRRRNSHPLRKITRNKTASCTVSAKQHTMSQSKLFRNP